MGNREQRLTAWVRATLAARGEPIAADASLRRISGDASFRGYYRALSDTRTWIAVDAPPDKEDSTPFVAIAQLLNRHGLNVPELYGVNLQEGFMLVSDLGDDLYLPRLRDPREAATLYTAAIHALVRLQGIAVTDHSIPPYDRGRLFTEMSLFPEWLLTRQLGLRLTRVERDLLDPLFELLIANALEQPQVLVHRDYHSRNLLVCGKDTPGIVDFQDAVIGPVSYDLVSLLRDCYIEWPRERLRAWVREYRAAAKAAHLAVGKSEAQFQRWFDLMGLQRHIKVAGIFCRLHLRDGKAVYLHDVPLVMKYILEVTAAYPECAAFHDWLRAAVLPRMAEHSSIFGTLRDKLGSFL